MAGNTKALRVRIKSVTSTLQLTKAMGLVASSKIRRANIAMEKAREYTRCHPSEATCRQIRFTKKKTQYHSLNNSRKGHLWEDYLEPTESEE